MGRNMLFITGTNVERTCIKNYRQAISHDRDIKKLIRKGLYSTRFNPIASMLFSMLSIIIVPIWKLIVSLLDAINNANLTSTELGKILFSFDIKLVSTITAVLFVVFSIFQYMKAGKDYRKEFTENKPDLRRALKFLFYSKAPKTPLELWDILQASIMVAQLTTSAERLFDTDVALIYGGMPYYEPMLLDSIYISWEGQEKIKPARIQKHYRKFFKEYSRRTITGEIEQKYFFDENHLQVSNCVFGILFLSEYLQSCIKEFFPESTGKFYIDCSELLIHSSEKTPEESFQGSSAYAAAMEIMGYSTNPSFFTFNNQVRVQDKIKIHKLDFISNKSIFGFAPEKAKPKGIFKKIEFFITELRRLVEKIREKYKNIKLVRDQKRKGIIRIPLKKLIALPYEQHNIEDPLPQTLSFAGPDKPSKALVIGSAEQNIILSILINKYKWLNDRNGIPNRDFCYYGFAESAFDTRGLLKTYSHNRVAPDGIEYLIGTESSAYGIPIREVLGKLDGKDHCRYAEIFKLEINELSYFFIYGYHAVATKIATLKFFVYLTEDEEASLFPNSIARIQYKLSCPLGQTFEKLKEFWDKGDPINGSREALLAKLKEISY